MKKSDKMRKLMAQEPIEIKKEIKEIDAFDFNKDGIVDEKDVEIVKKEAKKKKKSKKS